MVWCKCLCPFFIHIGSRLVPYLCVLMLCVVRGTESEIITYNGLRIKYSTVGTFVIKSFNIQNIYYDDDGYHDDQSVRKV